MNSYFVLGLCLSNNLPPGVKDLSIKIKDLLIKMFKVKIYKWLNENSMCNITEFNDGNLNISEWSDLVMNVFLMAERSFV